MKADAEKRVRVSLTLEAIAKAENIEVTDEEVEEELTKCLKLTIFQLIKLNKS